MKKFLAVAMAAVMVLGVSACSSSSSEEGTQETEQTEGTEEGTTEGGTILMGTSADFPPFEY